MKTVNDLFAYAWRMHWNNKRFKNSRWSKEVETLWRLHLQPTFGEMKISAVKVRHVLRWFKQYEDNVVPGNRALSVLRKAFGIAAATGRYEGENPCYGVQQRTERVRSRFATEEEVRKIAAILDRELVSRPMEVGHLKAMLLSGCRPTAVQRAKRADMRLMENGWAIIEFDGKGTADSGAKEKLLLHPEVVTIINATAAPIDGTLFGGTTAKYFWKRIQEEIGAKDLWIRDLRRTFASTALSNGVSLDMVGELLNHKSVQTTKRYAILSDTARLKSAQIVAEKLTAKKGI